MASAELSAEVTNANQAGKDFATGMTPQMIKIKEAIDPQKIPGFKGEDVAASKLYSSGAKLEEAGELARDNEQAQYLNAARLKRPSFKIIGEGKDPLFKSVQEIQAMSHDLTKSYTGCKNLPVGSEQVTKYDNQTCLENGERKKLKFKCDKKLEVACSNANAETIVSFTSNNFYIDGPALKIIQHGASIMIGSKENTRSGNCASHLNFINFYLKDVNEINEFMIAEIEHDDYLTISINGRDIFHEKAPMKNCERARTWKNGPFDIKKYLMPGSNSIELLNVVSGTGHLWLNLRASKKIKCDEANNYKYACDEGRSHLDAQLESSRCTEGPSVKVVGGDGVTVKRDCWKWEEFYSLLMAPTYTKEPICQILIDQGCGQSTTKCIEEEESYCKKRIHSFSCPFQVPARTVAICGDQLICPDGECSQEFQTYQPTTEDFKRAATALEVVKTISTNVNASSDQLSIFKGMPKECKKLQFNLHDCCRDKGWGGDLGLTKCNQDEIALGMAKEAHRIHYVDEYKTGGLLDQRKYQVYCVYPSKLARIIVEQGKAQQQKTYGSSRAPDCAGFTIDELQTLDFNVMDFSEFYADVMVKAETAQWPDINQTVEKIKASIQRKIPRNERGKL